MATTIFKIKLGAGNTITAYTNSRMEISGQNILIDTRIIRSLLSKAKRSITNTDSNKDAISHVTKIGKYLYKLLFNDKEIYANFLAHFNSIAHAEDHLRLVLDIDEPYLQSLPWELLTMAHLSSVRIIKLG